MKSKIRFFSALFTTLRPLRETIILFFLVNAAFAQDMDFARKAINDLCAPELYGRGYVNNGDEAAAHYLRNQLEKMGVTPFDFNFYQDFKMNVNTFPEAMEVDVDGKKLQPGIDFIVSPDAPSVSGEYELIYLDKSVIGNPNKMDEFEKTDKKGKAVLIDSTGFNKVQKEYFLTAEKKPV